MLLKQRTAEKNITYFKTKEKVKIDVGLLPDRNKAPSQDRNNVAVIKNTAARPQPIVPQNVIELLEIGTKL